MNACILDCSVAASSFLSEENANLANKLYSEMEKGLTIWVPSIWWYELNNVLIVALKHKRITELQVMDIIALFQSMPIFIDDNFSLDVFKTIHSFGKKYNLSAYDSAYLELAIRKKAALASLDEKLVSSAKKEKVVLYK